MSTHILYHANCADGAAAAGVVLIKYPDATTHAVQYGDYGPPDLPADADVIIVDFSYKRIALLYLKTQVKSLLVIDHHASAERELAGLDYCIFDASESGATLAWNHFFSHAAVPTLLKYIKDRDLWQWQLENSREFSAGWKLQQWDNPAFIAAQFYLRSTNSIVQEAIDDGTPVVRYQDACIASDIKKAKEFDLLEHTIPALNCTHSAIISETCGALAKGHPFAATYFDTPEKRVYSLRSAKDEPQSLDVSMIAEKFGGGGHKHAAAFSVPLRRIVPGVSPFPLTAEEPK